MKTNQIIRGGEFDYSAPTVEVLDITVEQGFAQSVVTASWDDSLDYTLQWGEDNQFE